MASLLSKLLSSKSQLMARSAFSFSPTTAAYSRFFSTDSSGYYEDNYNLKIRRCRGTGAHGAVNCSLSPHISATNNLTRVLNNLDEKIKVEYVRSCPRWTVMQDAKALHLVRDMSGLPKRNVNEFHPYTAKSCKLEAVFGCVRVVYNSSTIKVIVGQKGPDPGASYLGYSVKIELDPLYKILDTEMDVKNEVLKISIPKEKGEWIDTITADLEVYGND